MKWQKWKINSGNGSKGGRRGRGSRGINLEVAEMRDEWLWWQRGKIGRVESSAAASKAEGSGIECQYIL